VPGAIKPGLTRTRKIPAGKLTACYAALKLADCSQELQVLQARHRGCRQEVQGGRCVQGCEVHTLVHALLRVAC
jgi:hypothetical protein